jgi:hypothetical protein
MVCVYVLKDVRSDWLTTGHAQKFQKMVPQMDDKYLWILRIKASQQRWDACSSLNTLANLLIIYLSLTTCSVIVIKSL